MFESVCFNTIFLWMRQLNKMRNHIIYKNWKTHVLKIDHQKKIPSIPKLLLPRSRPHSPIQTKVCCPKTENETNNHFPCPCFNSNVMKRDFWKKYQKNPRSPHHAPLPALPSPHSHPHAPIPTLPSPCSYLPSLRSHTKKSFENRSTKIYCSYPQAPAPMFPPPCSNPNKNMSSKTRQRKK